MNTEEASTALELDTLPRTRSHDKRAQFIAIFMAESLLIHHFFTTMPFIVAITILVLLVPLTMVVIMLMFELGASLFQR